MQHTLAFLTLLQGYLQQDVYPFHTPGHKGGRGAFEQLKKILDDSLKMDVSLMSELDDIHSPNHALKVAQKEAASLYGAKKSFFSVNGTTGALQAMLLGTLKEGDKILLPRNAHRSIISSLVLTGVVPIYIYPNYDDEFGVSLQILTEQISQALSKEKVRAVFLTSPNYYGVGADLEKIAKIIKEKKTFMLVDEAHGPHLGFSSKLPKSAIQAGCDACAQSTHKIVGALTQCSILHINSNRIDIQKIQQAMSFLTTTSPNQLLLASLDAACHQLFYHGQQMADRAFALAEYMRDEMKKIDGLKLFEPKEAIKSNLFDYTKVTVNVSELGITGFKAAEFLRKHKLAVELADNFNILFLLTYCDDINYIDKSISVLKELAKSKHKSKKQVFLPNIPICQMAITPREAFYAKSKKMLLSQAVGKISTQEITFYPPGIPVILPGEIISQDLVEYCKQYLENSGKTKQIYISVVA